MNSLIEGVLYVVDDQQDMCDVMAMTMEQYDIRLDTSRTFDEAVKALHLYGILIVDNDLSSPGKDGNLLAKMFKEIRPAGYVIMVSGWSPNLRCSNEFVDTFMIKPFDVPEMVALIRALSL